MSWLGWKEEIEERLRNREFEAAVMKHCERTSHLRWTGFCFALIALIAGILLLDIRRENREGRRQYRMQPETQE